MINGFANPLYLWLIVLWPLFSWFYFKASRSGYLSFGRIPLLKQALAGRNYRWRKFLEYLLVSLIFILLVITLARPQERNRQQLTHKYGVDMMLLLDVSGSMSATDVEGGRLVAAKQILIDFVRMRDSDRLGLVVFGQRAITRVPLTFDRRVLANTINRATLGEMGSGTAIGDAIAAGLNRLRGSQAESKVLILVTDGESNAGNIGPIEAAKLAKDFGVKIYTIGIGTAEGSPMMVEHPQHGLVYARNQDGSLALTKLNVAELVEIAEVTSGQYFQATSRKELNNVFIEIDKLEKVKLDAEISYSYTEYYFWFAMPLFLLMTGYSLLLAFWWRDLPCI